MKRILALLLALTMLFANVPYTFAQGDNNAWQMEIPNILDIDEEYIKNNSETLFTGENVIEDPVLQEAINASYKREANLPVTKEMLKHVITLSPEKCLPHNPGEDFHKCKSIKGIEYAENLQYVSLPYQPIEDLSPLANLTKIRYINITGNGKVQDFSFLNKLVNVEELHIRMVKVKNIDALKNYKKLYFLDADSCEISDFSPLSNLVNLKYLNLDKNIFKENSAEAFSKLVNLEVLNINNKLENYGLSIFPEKIKSIEPLKNLTKLKEFHATGHDISDISILKNMKDLGTVFLNNNAIGDFSPVNHVKNVNGKNDQVIKTESDKFVPQLQTIELELGMELTADLLKPAIKNLPSNATVEIQNGLKNADMSKEGTTQQQVKITFSDSSRKFVVVNIKVVPKEEAKKPLEIYVIKGEVPIQATFEVEFLDGDQVVDTVSFESGVGSLNDYEVGKTYKLRIKGSDDYELVTPIAKVVEDGGNPGVHFLQTENEELTGDNIFIKVKDKVVEPAVPQNPLTVIPSKDGGVFTSPLEVEVLDNGNVIDTIALNGIGFMNHYEVGKTYTLRIKNNDSLELVTPYAKIVENEGNVGVHFLKTKDEAIADNVQLKLKDRAHTTPSEPETSKALSELKIKVLYKGEPKEGIQIRLNLWDELGIPSVITQPKTDSNGTITLKDLKKNTKYTVVLETKEYRFNPDQFEFKTDEDGKIKTIGSKNASEYADGFIVKAEDKRSQGEKTVSIDFKTVYKKDGQPAKDVEITANQINPNLSSYRNATSDEHGNVHFQLEGVQGGKIYAMTISKNGQFMWEFEPELIEVKVYEDHYEILNSKGNPNKENIFRVTKNDRNYLREDLRKIIAEAEQRINSGDYTPESVAALKTFVQGGKEELKKSETIPYYVEGHIANIKKGMAQLVLKENKKPEVKPDTKPEAKPDVKPSAPESKGYITLTPVKTEAPKVQAPELKPEAKVRNSIYVPKADFPVNLTDIPAGSEGDAMRHMVSRGVLKGMGNGKFEPNTTITRAMVTQVFRTVSKDKALGSPVNFTDVSSKNWFADPVQWASNNGLVAGYPDGSFKPNQKLTLEEFASLLDRLLTEYGIQFEKVKSVNPEDLSNVGGWSRDSVIRMAELGLISTNDNGKIDGKKEFSRAELASTLDQLVRFADKNR